MGEFFATFLTILGLMGAGGFYFLFTVICFEPTDDSPWAFVVWVVVTAAMVSGIITFL